MIDRQELQAMRGRCETARKAIEAVALHGDGKLFGELPAWEAARLLPDAVASVRDVPTLIDEVDRLNPAAYSFGLEACRERECGHVDWETADPDATCPEVQERVATLDDVKRAEYLDSLVQSLIEAAQRVQRGEPADSSGALRPLAELTLTGAENTYHQIKQWEQTGEESAW